MKYIKKFENLDDELNYENRRLVNNTGLNADLSEVEAALENGADINYIDQLGDTALISAAYFGNYGIMWFLIDKGADWIIKDEEGYDFIDYVIPDNPAVLDKIKRNYPEKYKEYLFNKEAEKYNL